MTVDPNAPPAPPADPPPAKTYTQAELDAQINGLKTKNTELLTANTSLKARAAVIGDRTPEEVQADLEFAAQAKADKLKAEGNFEALKTQIIEQHTKQTTELTQKLSKKDQVIFNKTARADAIAAITSAGGDPDLLMPHVLPLLQVAETDDDYVTVVVDAKGKPRIADGQATPMNAAQLVAEFKANPKFGAMFAADGASGSGARNNAGPNGAGVVVIPKNADPATYRRMKEDAIKRGVAYRVGD